MENMVVNPRFWSGKKVFVTGHTGFKGSWLTLWLSSMGAEVHGYALAPPTDPSMFAIGGIESILGSHSVGDIRNGDALGTAMQNAAPEIVLHLAAQPLVRYSYLHPLETYTTNVIGTVNLLEAIRKTGSVKAVVNVTTDKCYENREWVWPYRENEAMGGYDPYSSSKACAELVTAAYRRSFLSERNVHLASARAGNVIGGGDWAADRLLPDFLRALRDNKSLIIRSPYATRPWQHVLEPVAGYLCLAEALYTQGTEFAEAWNFGPEEADSCTVEWIMNRICELSPGASWQIDSNPQLHEAHALKLDSSKAKNKLAWYPRWNLDQAIRKTLEWDLAWRTGTDMNAFSLAQISSYQQSIR
jgi:CDP-glucose 4,6-dehydratase